MEFQLTDEFDVACKREGWAIFHNDGILEVLMIDNPEAVAEEIGCEVLEIQGNDIDAIDFVIEKAMAGSKLHAFALYLDGRSVDDECLCPEAFAEFVKE